MKIVKLNVMFGLNENYISKLRVTLESLLSNNSQHDICIYLFFSGNKKLNGQLHNELDYFKTKIKYEIINVKNELMSLTQVDTGAWAKDVLSKILAIYYLPDFIDHLLCLDLDLVIRDDISGFVHSNWQDFYAIACEDINVNKDYLHLENLKYKYDFKRKYFNAGFILLNLSKIRSDFTLDYLLQVMAENNTTFKLNEQDLLNCVFADNVYIQNHTLYNFFVNKAIHDKDSFIFGINNSKVLHFAGSRKPWQILYFNGHSHEYLNYDYKMNYLIKTLYAFSHAILSRIYILWLRYKNDSTQHN